MKKLLLLTAILSVALCSQVYAAENTEASTLPTKQISKPCCEKLNKPQKRDFGKTLNLTDDQKAKAKEIHKKGFEQIKPIMDKIELKQEEIEAVKRSSLAPEVQAKRIVTLRKDIRELRHQAREVQMKNMKEFESILTDTQKEELKKIKEEGRKKFERNHKRPMFGMPPRQGFGCPKRPPIELPVEKPVPVEK